MVDFYPQLRMPLLAAGLIALVYLLFCPVASRGHWSDALAGMFVGGAIIAALSLLASRRTSG